MVVPIPNSSKQSSSILVQFSITSTSPASADIFGHHLSDEYSVERDSDDGEGGRKSARTSRVKEVLHIQG